VIDLKTKKPINEKGRTPLYVSHLDGKVYGRPKTEEEDFGDRMQRIRASLEKINQLMADLKHAQKRSQEDYE